MDEDHRLAAVDAFRKALAIAGTQTAFASAVGLKQQTVSNLIARGDVLPPHAVLAAERNYGISRHVLRPDIYPPVITSGPLPTGAVVETSKASVAFDSPAELKRAHGV